VTDDDGSIKVADDDDAGDTRVRSVPVAVDTSAERDRAYLVVLAGMSRGQMFKLDQTRAIIGRGPEAGIRLADEGISREHAAVQITGDKVTVQDLGSTTILKFTYHDRLDEQFQQQMYESALRDGLTKVFNRKHFDDLLNKEFAFASRHVAPLALLFIDLDHFKNVNDTHGHPAGDFVLSEVSGVLASAIRSEDVLARFGGEEFCVLCRGTDGNGARELADRLRLEIEQRRLVYGGKIIPVTISVGVAALPDPTVLQAAALLAAADKALYQAKRSGRNRVVLAPPGI
jgi:two-component system cell cycle response regulator